MSEKCYLIKRGSEWAQVDDAKTRFNWVKNIGLASLHTKEWADKTIAGMAKFGHRGQAVHWDAALKSLRNERDQALQSAFIDKVRRYLIKNGIGFYTGWIDGVPKAMGEGMTAVAYAKQVLESQKSRMSPR